MLDESFRIEQLVENTVSHQQMEILNQMNSVISRPKEEDERLHAWQSRVVIESTRAQPAHSIEVASERTQVNELTVQHQMPIQQRDTTATAAQIDVDNLRDELCASKEQVSFMRSETPASSSHREDLHDQLSHTQELYHCLAMS